MKRIALFFFIISPFLFSQCDFIKTRILGQDSDTTSAYQERLDSIRRADSIRKAKARKDSLRRLDSIREAKEQARKDSLARLDSIRKAKKKQKKNQYHIISGSFKTPSYAESYKDRMINHYNYSQTKILQSKNNFNLVAIKSFPRYNEALRDLKDIRRKGHFQVWMYKSNE